MRITAIFLVIFAGASANFAQNRVESSIRGLISDSATGRPIENANVFVSGSTYGTGSGSDGRYAFKVNQTGTFQLVFSRVGYDVNIVDVRISKSDTLVCNVSLSPKVIVFNEVEVSAEVTARWHQQYLDFLRVFLGTGANSAQCEIMNPDVLDFSSDPPSETLEAKASGPLIVTNKALGYELTVSLLEFHWNTRMDYGHFLVYPSFRNMASSNPGTLGTWDLNRRASYKGSLRHFLRSIVESNIDSNGFVMHRGELADLRREGGRFVFPDEIRTEPVAASVQRRWMCDPWLRVDRRWSEGNGESYISTGSWGALIDPAGNLEDPRSVNLLGRWSRERMADMLPLDFDPHPEARARR